MRTNVKNRLRSSLPFEGIAFILQIIVWELRLRKKRCGSEKGMALALRETIRISMEEINQERRKYDKVWIMDRPVERLDLPQVDLTPKVSLNP